jgi:hypothetical protein
MPKNRWRLKGNELEDEPMAKIIEFYRPTKFSKSGKWIPPLQRGKVIEFGLPTKKSA